MSYAYSNRVRTLHTMNHRNPVHALMIAMYADEDHGCAIVKQRYTLLVTAAVFHTLRRTAEGMLRSATGQLEWYP